jgi:hypothetical protein
MVKRAVTSATVTLCALAFGVAGGYAALLPGRVASWQRVRSSLVKAGVVAERDASKGSAHADVITTDPDAVPYWYVWVFRDAGTRDREVISGLHWRMALRGKRTGQIYWTGFVNDIGAESGSYYAVTLYAGNVALVTRLDRDRKTPHPASPARMPALWIKVDRALSKLPR